MIDELSRALRKHGLQPVGRWEGTLEALCPAILHPREVLLVQSHGATEARRYRLLREIVARRTEAACGDDRTGAIEGGADCGGDVLRGITDSRSPRDDHADGGELAREVRGIGVDREAE